MHRDGLAMTMSGNFGSVIVGTVVIVAGGDDFAALDEDCAQIEAHCRLSGSVGALRKVELGLVHHYRWGILGRMVDDSVRGMIKRLYQYMTRIYLRVSGKKVKSKTGLSGDKTW